MGFVMHNPTFRSPLILAPLLLDMDQRPLPLTECNVLQPGEREELVFGVIIRVIQEPSHPAGSRHNLLLQYNH